MNHAILNDSPIKVIAEVNDSSGVDAVYLNYTNPGGLNFNETMVFMGNLSFTFTIPSQTVAGNISFFVTAVNNLGYWNQTENYTVTIDHIHPPDKEPPFVKSTIPVNASVDVPLDVIVIIEFNEPMRSDNVYSTITISPEEIFIATWGGVVTNTELTISFNNDLQINTTYKITLSTEIRDLANNKMISPYILKFTTIAPAHPPKDWDKDDDGMNDTWETNNGLDPNNSADANQDNDNDGLSNLQEFLNHTSPTLNDTDLDGMNDGWEVLHSLDPLLDDSADDPDSDNYTNYEEYLGNTNPIDPFDHPGDLPDDKDGGDKPKGFGDYLLLILLLIIIIVIISIVVGFLYMRRSQSQDQDTGKRISRSDHEPRPEEYEEEISEEDEYDRIYGPGTTSPDRDIDEDLDYDDEEYDSDLSDEEDEFEEIDQDEDGDFEEISEEDVDEEDLDEDDFETVDMDDIEFDEDDEVDKDEFEEVEMDEDQDDEFETMEFEELDIDEDDD
jgi:hypothetical protein